jgi:hypothetical protein
VVRVDWRRLVALSVTLAVVLFPSSSLARETHQFEEVFGGGSPPTFVNPSALAVGPSGAADAADLYVVDYGADPLNSTVERYNPDGSPDEFSAVGSNVLGSFALLDAGSTSSVQIAIAPPGSVGGTEGNIYIPVINEGLLRIFSPDGNELGEISEYKEGPGAGGPATSMGGACGVSVDDDGDLFIGDFSNGVHLYSPLTNPPLATQNTANFTTVESSCNVLAGAGPNAGSVFINGAFLSLFRVDRTTKAIECEVQAEQNSAVAINPANGHLFVAQGSRVTEYEATSTDCAKRIDAFEATGEVRGMAVDGASNNVYLSIEGDSHVEVYGRVSVVEIVSQGAEVGKTAAMLSAVIDTEATEATECAFEYGKTTAYGSTVPCDAVDGTPITGPGEIPVDEGNHTVSAQVGGLEKNTNYHFRLKIANSAAPTFGDDETFETLGPPIIGSELVSSITPSRAIVSGKVDPRGEATSFAVEYVTQEQFDTTGYADATAVPVPARNIGSGVGDVAVSQEIGGLQPATTYHARLVATNASEAAAHGADLVFATFDVASGLLDRRAYELVTPVEKAGEVFPPEGLGLLGGTCFKCLPGGERPKMPMQASPDGASLVYEGQPFFAGLGSEANEYLARRDPLRGWATEGLSKPEYRTNSPSPQLQGAGFLAFSSDLARAVIFQAEPALSPDAPAGYANLYLWKQGSESLEPLLTEAPPNRPAVGPSPQRFLPIFGGANAGEGAVAPFSHVIFAANDSLTAATSVAPAAPAVGPSDHALFEWADGGLKLVSVMPGNLAAAANAVIGSGHLLEETPAAEGPVFENAISADGSRIYWTDLENGQLYVRIDGEETRSIPGPGGFLTAGTDGGKVLLSDGRIYDLAGNEAIDLTSGEGGFQGTLGTSDDLSSVYFVDSKALTPSNAENANGEHAEEGAQNLYLWREGVRTFIGRLLPSDKGGFGVGSGANGRMGTWKPAAGNRTAQVSPDGRFLAFTSAAGLTGYDNSHRQGIACENEAGVLCAQVFEYDAASDELSCASCNPTGQRPLGHSNLSLIEPGVGTFFHQPRNLTAGGRLFLESQDTISSHDLNGHIADVYEWEPNGVGTCAKAGGCVSLISSGNSPNDSQFLSASLSGDDAFFITRESLSPKDQDDLLDVYDARVGGGLVEPGVAPCSGDGCRGPTLPPPAKPTAGSALFMGSGNPVAKKHHHKKRHKKRKKRHGKKKHARGQVAGRNRGQAR